MKRLRVSMPDCFGVLGIRLRGRRHCTLSGLNRIQRSAGRIARNAIPVACCGVRFDP